MTREAASGLRRSLARLQVARDSAIAVVTVPASAPAETHLEVGSTRPAVDLALWTHHVRYSRHRAATSLDHLVEHYRPHAEAMARRFYRHGEPVQDLTQTALEALMVALQRFDPERRRPFLAFAKPTITGVIQRHFRDTGWSIRVPRRAHELAVPVREAYETLCQDLGREPTQGEVADLVGITPAELADVLSAKEARQPGSLDVVDPVTNLNRAQVVGGPDPGLAWAENHTALQQAMALLADEERLLLQRYFFDERTQSEIAGELGCSQMQVSRLLASAIRRLRRRVVGP